MILFHVTPRIFTWNEVELVDATIDNFNRRRAAGEDVVHGTPYPNKGHKAAYRKGIPRFTQGLLLRAPRDTTALRIVRRWMVGFGYVVTHCVDYRLRDHEFTLASDDTSLWWARSYAGRAFGARGDVERLSAMPPVMRCEPISGCDEGQPVLKRIVDEDGWTSFMHQAFDMPSIEPERLNSRRDRRLPPLDSAFDLERP